MPPARPSRRSSKQNKDDNEPNTSPKAQKDVEQWVFLVNDLVLEVDKNEENKPVICKLRHPRTEKGALYLISHGDKNIFEVTAFKEEYRSWIIENRVHSDGRLMITTPMDPMFLALPYLVTAEKTGKFMTLDQIIADEEFPECNRLPNLKGLEELFNVADVKGDDDLRAYRYSKDKTLSWLKAKTEKLANALSDRNVCVSGAQSSTFVRGKRSMSSSKEDFVRFAHGMVSDYISEELSVELRDYMGIPAVVEKKENLEPPNKKIKMEDITPIDDYSENKAEVKTKPTKMTTAQKQLNKVDKSGMKSISSFFSPKPKT